MLHFAICDDNAHIVTKLKDVLEGIFLKNDIDAKVDFICMNATDLMHYMDTNPPSVLFLDINLKDSISGIELAEKIREKNKYVYIVFTTGHLEYALVAYKVKTFDYLPKPITPERLEETVLRLVNDMSNKPVDYLKLENNKLVINKADISYIKRNGMKITFHTRNHEYEAYSSFNKLSGSLSDRFVRCHKSYIVNIDNISNIEMGTNTIYLNDNSVCYIGPKYKNDFMEVFNHGNFSNNMECFNNAKRNAS